MEKNKNIFNDRKDDTKSFTKKEIEEGKGLSLFAYLVPLVPFFLEKKNKYVKYHANQGMNLLIIIAIYYAFYYIFSFSFSYIYMIINCRYIGSPLCSYSYGFLPWYILMPLRILGLILVSLCIFGIVDVWNGKAKEIPVINKFKIFK